jgi:hypothetical protein
MFWKKKPTLPGQGDALPPHVRKVLEAADRPDAWESLDEGALQMVAFLRLTRYGSTQNVGDQPALQRLYSVLRKRISADGRLRLEQSVCQYALEGKTGVLALVPFLLGETDLSVISTAALDYAMLMPRVNGDPLSGPKFLISQYDQAAGNDALRLGILTGLILLGDERLLPLVKGRWRDFKSSEDRRRIAAAKSGFVSTLLVEFLMDWLENTTDESDVGAIAGAMARMPLDAQVEFVVRQRRCFPASDAEPGKEIEYLEKWSFADYAEVIRPRLDPLIAKEAPPKVIPAILEGWQYAE